MNLFPFHLDYAMMPLMNYLTFDPNIQNALLSLGMPNVFCNRTDYSVFSLKNKTDSFFDTIENDFYSAPLTILYSYCPWEICGLYATIFHLKDYNLPIYITSPDKKSNANFISYSDYPPNEILSQVSNKKRLSNARKRDICDTWRQLLEENRNLRLWKSNTLVSAPDDYFDSDIQNVLQCKANSDMLLSIQSRLRSEYHISLNSKYIEWRLKYISKQINTNSRGGNLK